MLWGMWTPLLAALALTAPLSAAPPAPKPDSAYESLAALAAGSDDGRIGEARMPEGGDVRSGRGAWPRHVPPAAPAAAPENDEVVRDALSDRRPVSVVRADPQPASSWAKLFRLLLPSMPPIPELRASTAPFAGARTRRPSPEPFIPRETEEGMRRGLADMMAVMSAGAAPAPAGGARR